MFVSAWLAFFMFLSYQSWKEGTLDLVFLAPLFSFFAAAVALNLPFLFLLERISLHSGSEFDDGRIDWVEFSPFSFQSSDSGKRASK